MDQTVWAKTSANNDGKALPARLEVSLPQYNVLLKASDTSKDVAGTEISPEILYNRSLFN
jgi:hypothetical protein